MPIIYVIFHFLYFNIQIDKGKKSEKEILVWKMKNLYFILFLFSKHRVIICTIVIPIYVNDNTARLNYAFYAFVWRSTASRVFRLLLHFRVAVSLGNSIILILCLHKAENIPCISTECLLLLQQNASSNAKWLKSLTENLSTAF